MNGLKEVKFSKKQILESKKYKNFYVLRELLKDGAEYSAKEVDNVIAVYGRKAGV